MEDRVHQAPGKQYGGEGKTKSDGSRESAAREEQALGSHIDIVVGGAGHQQP